MPWSKITETSLEPASDGDDARGRILSYPEAIREALAQSLAIDPAVFVMGQGVDDPSGMFGATRGLHETFGADRVFDTPLAETALTGVAVGAALGGMRPVYFHNRPDFLYLAMDQLANHAAKWHYMFGGAACVPLVLWACTGRGWGSGAQHSQAVQGLFFQIPGLKLVMPSTCYDAKGLLIAAIKDDNPVLILDHRFNFRNRGYVPEEMYAVPLGRAAVRREGRDVTVVAASHLVMDALRAAEEFAAQGVSVEVVDPRTLRPLDEETILNSVAKTGRLVVADTGWRSGGVAAEICALAAERCFDALKAPPRRVAGPDLPTPAGCTLEEAYYIGKNEIVAAVRGVLKQK
ncbi:MAG: alpha-ketoacid dehydrogenase subunit beta [Desulfovibrionaceae bacterium]|nr:alpha-ketoacid dehydrogenase subunit beta [Desulfovibrionaceae bacterium]MBF0512690.1 alpha-ketoacid dehydrogenase subunit beta [Desulfovibrionaceae bacterium]